MLPSPAVRLPLWAACVVSLQMISAWPLASSAAAAALAAFLCAPAHARKLFRRVRYLALAIAVIFGWSVPGQLLWPAAGAFSPSVEGLWLAAEHLARLAGVLALVALLLGTSTREQLVSALHAGSAPLSWLGIDRGRAALRLALVLRYAERELPLRSWRNWLASAPQGEEAASVRIPLEPRRASDGLWLAAGVALLLAAWWVR